MGKLDNRPAKHPADPCATPTCKNKAGTGKNADGQRVCVRCRYGDCVVCGKKARQPNPNGDGGVCGACRYGNCVVCGKKAKHPNPNGDGGVCGPCYYGDCVVCGNKAATKNPNGSGGVCAPCFYGDCVVCGNKGIVPNPNGDGAVCGICLYGHCVVCGNKANYPNQNGVGGVCVTHRYKGSDYVAQSPWQPNTSFLYFVYWEEEKVIKIGVGTSEQRHKKWLDGNGELVRLLVRSPEATDGLSLKGLEKPIINAAIKKDYAKASLQSRPQVLVDKKTKNSELLNCPSLEDAYRIAWEIAPTVEGFEESCSDAAIDD